MANFDSPALDVFQNNLETLEGRVCRAKEVRFVVGRPTEYEYESRTFIARRPVPDPINDPVLELDGLIVVFDGRFTPTSPLSGVLFERR